MDWSWKILRIPLLAVLLGYVTLALLAPLAAASLLYYPNFGSRRAPEGMKKIPGPDGTEVAVLHLPNPEAKYTLWFFHGNAEDLGDLEPFLRQLREAGFAVFAHDYPGYGLSTGQPSEDAIYASARAARRHLRETLHVPAARTLLYGRSLGGGPALQMAVEERPAGLVLQSTFLSAFRVVTRWRLLPFDPYQNLSKVKRIECPLLVMHGRADEVIPFWHGEKLFARAPEPKRSLWVPGAHHNDFVAAAGSSYWQALREFNELCAQAAAAAR